MRFCRRAGLRFADAEVKKRLADEASVNKTVIAIAYECGFSTKSSFNAVFRKSEGITPTEFRRKVLAGRGALGSQASPN